MSRKIKVKLKVYEYKGMLRREFSSVTEAQDVAEKMAQKYPDKVFKHHIMFEDAVTQEPEEASKTDSIDVSGFFDAIEHESEDKDLSELNDFDIFKEE